MAIFGSGQSAIGTGIVINLYDNFSANADKISSKFRTLEDLSESAAQKIEESLGKMKLGFASMAFGGLLLAPLALGVTTTIKLEDKLADVQKTTGMAADEANRLKQTLFSLNTRSSIDDLLSIATIGGQVGVATNQIEGFTKAVDKVTVALGDEFSGGAEEVAGVLGKLRNTFSDMRTDEIGDDLLHIGNAINALGASGFATGPVVSDFANRIGGVGIPLGLSTGEVLGLSASLQELGINAERGGTAVSRTLQRMLTNTEEFANFAGMAVGDFKEMLNTDLYGAFQQVLKGSQKYQNDATGMGEALDKLGLTGAGASEVFLKLGSQIDLLNEKTDLATESLKGTDSIMGEFNIKNETTGAMLDKLKKKFVEISDNLGQVFLPMLRPIISTVSTMASLFAALSQTQLGKVLIKLTAVAGFFAIAIGAVIVAVNVKKFVIGELAQTLITLGKKELAATFLTKGLAAGFRQATLAAIPLLASMAPIIIIGAAIAGTIYTVTKSMNAFKGVLDGTTTPAKGFLGVMQKIGGVIFSVMEIWKSATNEGFSLSEKTAQALEDLGIYEFVLNLATWVVRVKAFFTGMWDAVSQVFSAIGDVISYLWNGLMDLAEAFGFDISKNLSDIDSWIVAGKALGYVIAGVLIGGIIALTVAFASLAISVLAATWPLLAIIAVGVGIYLMIKNWGAIWDWLVDMFYEGIKFILKLIFLPWVAMAAGIAWLYENWDEVWTWVGDTVSMVFDWIGDKIGQFVSWIGNVPSMIISFFTSLPSKMLNIFTTVVSWVKDTFLGFITWMSELPSAFLEWGMNVVNAIWDGILSGWDWLKQGMIGLISELPGGKMLLKFFGVSGEDGSEDGGGVPDEPSPVGMSQLAMANGNNNVMYSESRGGTNTSTYEKTESVQDVKLYIDGKEIKSRMDKIDREQNSRL